MSNTRNDTLTDRFNTRTHTHTHRLPFDCFRSSSSFFSVAQPSFVAFDLKLALPGLVRSIRVLRFWLVARTGSHCWFMINRFFFFFTFVNNRRLALLTKKNWLFFSFICPLSNNHKPHFCIQSFGWLMAHNSFESRLVCVSVFCCRLIRFFGHLQHCVVAYVCFCLFSSFHFTLIRRPDNANF